MCRRAERSKPIEWDERSDEALSSFTFDDDEEKMNYSTFYHVFWREPGNCGRLHGRPNSESINFTHWISLWFERSKISNFGSPGRGTDRRSPSEIVHENFPGWNKAINESSFLFKFLWVEKYRWCGIILFQARSRMRTIVLYGAVQ